LDGGECSSPIFSGSLYSTNLDGSGGKTSALLGNLTGVAYAELPVAMQKAVSIMSV
jgi:hypothetical protein